MLFTSYTLTQPAAKVAVHRNRIARVNVDFRNARKLGLIVIPGGPPVRAVSAPSDGGGSAEPALNRYPNYWERPPVGPAGLVPCYDLLPVACEVFRFGHCPAYSGHVCMVLLLAGFPFWDPFEMLTLGTRVL